MVGQRVFTNSFDPNIIKYEEVVCGKREWNRSGGKVYGKEQSVILRDREVEKNFWGGILWS